MCDPEYQVEDDLNSWDWDDWGEEDDELDDEPEADPDCPECGGQGGWVVQDCTDPANPFRAFWQECDCVS